MSGKFMKVKRILIPTITLAIMASQLMGCGAMGQSELLKMINRGEQIEIEVAVPAFHETEQGEESPLVWVELAQLETSPTIRSSWDDTLLVTRTDTGKNGIFYVNEAGENENNNTLRVALHNREVQKLFESDSTLRSLADSVEANYADLEITDPNNRNEILKAVYMGINAYFNLLPDNTPNYCNADSTLTRAEFMTMVFRADTPVKELASDGILTDAVGNSEYNPYAQGVTANSYLDLESKSLNSKTYNGNITRAEAIHILVSRYYSDELQSVNLADTNITFTDAKDGGDIATAQKFIEDGQPKDCWKTYELTHALQNADDGLPTELYKALVVAQQNGLISTETRWDEAITLSESLELLVKALMNEPGINTYTAKLGTIDNYTVEIPDEATGNDSETDLFEGNGAGANFIISEDFPYVDREADTEQPPAESQEQQPEQQPPAVEQPVSQPIQQPSNPPAGLGNMGTFGDIPTGTGDGSIANGSFGTLE
ncbi:MAG: hypothetical protein NC123_19360 [Butyrivibrio sp.]|nr:hypothetical protein [Butyrivibrio sp.]